MRLSLLKRNFILLEELFRLKGRPIKKERLHPKPCIMIPEGGTSPLYNALQQIVDTHDTTAMGKAYDLSNNAWSASYSFYCNSKER
jgi:hypothetical protein